MVGYDTFFKNLFKIVKGKEIVNIRKGWRRRPSLNLLKHIIWGNFFYKSLFIGLKVGFNQYGVHNLSF